jgi:cytochrome b involved in lipid metabolism
VWVAIKGVVYDVTGNELYRVGGAYSRFGGKDASISLGTMQFDDLDRRGWLQILNAE